VLLTRYFWSHFYLSLITKPSLPLTTLIDLFSRRNNDYSVGSFRYQFRSKYHILTKILVKRLLLHTKIHIRPTIPYLKFRCASLDTKSLNERRELAGPCIKCILITLFYSFVYWLQWQTARKIYS